ncbi:metallophosphoesterase family protein [Donghicola mangrovi]|uniref:Serine/threonine protein phosphatase n=1 Tax=Donghicola mangrovi TaxID=2729614 RepID=A0A850QE44_9RHOB|nr:metallophosphoesterase family protein [Donghicola mangrovi]NVO25218.1 serine/threonine protein phosphatase [Donghicola mangrovi]
MISLNRLFGRSPTTQATSLKAPNLAEPLFVIGDIHGCLEQLESLLDTIWKRDGFDARIITVGDMIDRGPHSAQVLQKLVALQRVSGARLTCLKGNHEQMMLDFLAKPSENGLRWIQSGGINTLESFNISLQGQLTSLEDLADQLRARMGAELLNWLQRLPTFWSEGNVGVVHAAADPALPLDEQREDTLLWGHSDFRKQERPDGMWIIHGHTIVKEPRIRAGRISVDTGAYKGHPLSAAVIKNGTIDFLQT